LNIKLQAFIWLFCQPDETLRPDIAHMLDGTYSEPFDLPPLFSDKDSSEHGGRVYGSIHSSVACSRISSPRNSFGRNGRRHGTSRHRLRRCTL
jgi:hypothetical protein